ncbi:VirK family protein [Legionella tunisiensis]|uniref:VirK family protein n=1 Tax=Legionella tunisiensis TaxID=1034944 RepID=UPI00030863AC|nr:VirK family protein [Legionella tunisiensis]
MKKQLMSILALLSFSAHASELSTFAEVADAVVGGKQLSFVVSFKNCESENSVPNIKASFRPHALMLIANNRVTASDKHVTLDNPNFLRNPTIEYVKYNINVDSGVEIQVTVMSAKDYRPVDHHQINCQLGKGFRVFSDERQIT